MKNFKALFELMGEKYNDQVNLFSVRKMAILSVLEVFKDIIPEYRIGQINLKTQTGKCHSEKFFLTIVKYVINGEIFS